MPAKLVSMKLRHILLLIGLLSTAFSQTKDRPPSNPEWTKPFPPFHIVGNVYWVGTWDLSTYLITTPEGHILVNTGLPETVPRCIILPFKWH